MRKIVAKLAALSFVRSALEEEAGLDAFRQPPTPRIILGMVLIGASYLIGWPVVGLLAALSAYYKAPLLVAVGGPLVYGLSHLVFLAGMYLAGAKYTWIFFRWLTRKAMLKLMRRFPAAPPPKHHPAG